MATNPGGYTPPVGFHFKVDFIGIGNNNDARFQSVTGLTVEYDVETYKEGGENRFEHKLPVRTKYGSELSLKRGLLVNSAVMEWCRATFASQIVAPLPYVLVTLLNENHQPLQSWRVMNVWPKKWSVSEFNAQENTLAVETLDLNYSFFTAL